MATASADVGKNGQELRRWFAACALAEMVSWVVAALPDGVTVEGLNEQLVPLGNPELAKLTVELNPFCGVTVSVTAPSPPELTVNEPGDAPNVKLGGLGTYGEYIHRSLR